MVGSSGTLRLPLRGAMALALVLLAAGLASGAQAQPPRSPNVAEHAWTLARIVQAPKVMGLKISRDGRYAMYIVRAGSLEKDAKSSALHLVDLGAGVDRLLRTSTWISDVQVVPGADDWSLLADLGEGVQLYRVDRDGRFSPFVVNPHLDEVGGADEGPQRFGVSGYGWAPDGKSFWYFKRNEAAPDAPQVNPPYLPLVMREGAAKIELRVRWSDGADVLAEALEPLARRHFGFGWSQGAFEYDAIVQRGSSEVIEHRRLRREDPSAQVVETGALSTYAAIRMAGLNGGRLQTRGNGAERRLVEALPSGRTIDWGKAGYSIGHEKSAGFWKAPDGKSALLGAFDYESGRHELLRMARSGKLEVVPATTSLTNCDVDEAFRHGVCVAQSVSSPPRLVRFDPRRGDFVTLVDLAPELDVVTPLRVERRQWRTADDLGFSGYLIYPRGYEAGKAYPAILVTHGPVDASDVFVDQGFQWDYPIQLLAERGYLVIAANEPHPFQSAELQKAYDAWSGPTDMSRERMQDLLWIDTAIGFEEAVKGLVEEGLVDPARVGIAGYSRGSQIVNVAMSHTRIFRAASSGDGGYLEPGGHAAAPDSYNAVYGGSPYDPDAQRLYQRLALTLRAAQSSGAFLQQVTAQTGSQLDLHNALRAARVSSELSVYPNETHLLHTPSKRLAAMQENLDWFDFWLRDAECPDPAQATRYARWRALRGQAVSRTHD